MTRRGTPWSPQEDAQLIMAYNAGLRTRDINGLLVGRSGDSINARIYKLAGDGALIAKPRVQRHHSAAEDRGRFITPDDLAWMQYWRQPRAVRKAPVSTGETRP